MQNSMWLCGCGRQGVTFFLAVDSKHSHSRTTPLVARLPRECREASNDSFLSLGRPPCHGERYVMCTKRGAQMSTSSIPSLFGHNMLGSYLFRVRGPQVKMGGSGTA